MPTYPVCDTYQIQLPNLEAGEVLKSEGLTVLDCFFRLLFFLGKICGAMAPLALPLPASLPTYVLHAVSDYKKRSYKKQRWIFGKIGRADQI